MSRAIGGGGHGGIVSFLASRAREGIQSLTAVAVPTSGLITRRSRPQKLHGYLCRRQWDVALFSLGMLPDSAKGRLQVPNTWPSAFSRRPQDGPRGWARARRWERHLERAPPAGATATSSSVENRARSGASGPT
jgi:hypothetical protein